MLVISPAELDSRIRAEDAKKDKNLLIVDVRSFSNYAEGHIPGAVNIDLMQFHWIDTSRDGILQFNKQTKLLLSNIGVSENKFVVFYDDVSGPSAARGVWLLLYFSHHKVAMLDGGMNGWKTNNLPIETKTNPFIYSKFKGRPDPRILASYETVKSALREKKSKKKNSHKTIILDARSKEEFDGTSIRAAHAGHIPKAVNIDWNSNISNSSFLDSDELAKLYAPIPKDAEVITYCQGGYRAANSFVALKMLGYKNVKMYLGSWGEWGNKVGFPFSR
jgi:thiosulfate/3-mercaptopyruvate sulfurtransferase